MNLETVSTYASIGTFVVIAATAAAALVQLRHMRAANEITYVRMFFEGFENPQFREAFDFVRTGLREKLKDPTFRAEIVSGLGTRQQHPEAVILNLLDQWGLYYRDGVIDRDGFMRLFAGVIVEFWNKLEPVVALSSDPMYGNLGYQHFEYLTVHARKWLAAHPAGDYPRGERRIPLPRADDLFGA